MIARRERQRVFLGLARLDIKQQQFVAAAMVVQPRQHDIMAAAVHGSHRAAMVADRRRHPVVPKAPPRSFVAA